MTLHTFTTQEKIDEVERLIEVQRPTRAGMSAEELRRYDLWKAVAADLRARLKPAPSASLYEIERRIVAVKRSETRLGRAQGALIGVAQEVIGRWPLVKQALEKFAAEVEAAGEKEGSQR